MLRWMICLCLVYAMPVMAGTFNAEGVTFKYPSGWFIEEQYSIMGMGYYVAIEKAGDDESGLATVSWVKDSLDLRSFLDETKTALDVYLWDTFKCSEDLPVIFGTDTVWSATYEGTLWGIAFEGTVYTFYRAGKSFSVVFHGAVDDRRKNAGGFEMIRSTLNNS